MHIALFSLVVVAECFVLPSAPRSVPSGSMLIKRMSHKSDEDVRSSLIPNERIEKPAMGIQGLLWILGEGGPTGVWDVVPYVGAAVFIGWRGKKAYKAFQIKQEELVEEFGRSVSSATMKANRRPYYDTLYSIYRRKLMFRRKEPMLCSALKYICKQPLSVQRLQALREFIDACRINDPAAIFDKAGLVFITKTNERGKLLFYARRLGITPPALEAKIISNLQNNPEALAITQKVLAETAFRESLKLQKQVPGNFVADPEAASELGVSEDDAQSILDQVNTPAEVLEERARQADKEDWLEELEAKVTEESGPVDMASDNPSAAYQIEQSEEESQKMVKAECGECGYTLFIAKGREWKFFGDSYTCANCGAPRSAFTITDMADDSDDDSTPESPSFLVDDPIDDVPSPPPSEIKDEELKLAPVDEESPVQETDKNEEPPVPIVQDELTEVVEETKAETPVVPDEIAIIEEALPVDEPAPLEDAPVIVSDEESISADEQMEKKSSAEDLPALQVEAVVEELIPEKSVIPEEPVEETKTEETESEKSVIQEEPIEEIKVEEPVPEDPATKAPIEDDEISIIVEAEDSSKVESVEKAEDKKKDDNPYNWNVASS